MIVLLCCRCSATGGFPKTVRRKVLLVLADRCIEGHRAAGISKGTPLSFSFVFESGVGWVLSEMDQLQSAGSLVGIRLHPINQF